MPSFTRMASFSPMKTEAVKQTNDHSQSNHQEFITTTAVVGVNLLRTGSVTTVNPLTVTEAFRSTLVNTSHGILLGLFILATTAHGAATRYVSPTGNDSTGNGSINAPYKTLQKAHDMTGAGDTIYMRGGTYFPAAQTTITRSGSNGNYIKVFAYPGETPVIDAINHPAGDYIIRMNSASWWHIKGLELKNGAKNGLYLAGSSSNNIIENNNIHHIGRLAPGGCGCGTAIAIYGTGGNNLVLNNDVHDNDDALSSDGGGANGINLVTTGTGNVIRGNRIWRNSDDGIDMWDAAPALIENNWSWENGYTLVGSNLVVRGNGVGYKLGGSATNDGGHTVRNNLAWLNRVNGFHENSGDLPITLYNNTAWNNGANNFTFFHSGNTFRNNINFGSRGNVAGSDTYNSWTLPVTVNSADFASLDYTVVTAPRNPDGSLPTINFLRLVAASDLINKGTNVGIPFNGSAPDLGAYEYYVPEVPTLSWMRSGNNLVISWTNAALGYTLESTLAFSPVSWLPVGTAPVMVSGQITVTVEMSNGAAFYRLKK